VTSVAVVAHERKRLGGGLEELRSVLARRGIPHPLWRQVPKSKEIPKQVRKLVKAGADLIFVWGGDGSVQRCIDAIGKAPVTLAILPAGTANLFATNLRIPDELEAAVDVGLGGLRRTLDVGSVNGERFGVMAGTGFDAIMIRDADAGLKDRVGKFAYVVAGVRGMRRDPVETEVAVDGRPWFRGPASCVLVGNMGDVIGGISAFPDARPDDGRLNLGVITSDGPVDWARTLGRAAVGDAASSPFVRTTTATKIDVRLKGKVPYELDGGDRPKTDRLKFRVKPAAITVCVPEPKVGR
jgi:YegS/Rv2252/BmrU family lipid kinase